MSTIFEKIISGEIPSYKVAETEDYLAFLDAFPLRKGHTLVIPKKPVDYLFDLDDESYAGLQMFSKIVATAMRKVLPCERIGVAVIGLEVPHAHIHLIPINSVADIDFSQKKMKFSNEEMKEIASKIKEQIA